MKNQGYYFKIKICQPEFNRVFLEYKDAVGEFNLNKEEQKSFNGKDKKEKPAFIKVEKGASVDGLTLINNIGIGDADFINNQGELRNTVAKGNKHIVFNTPSNLSEKQWWKKLEIIISLILLVIAFISIPWWPNILDWIKSAV